MTTFERHVPPEAHASNERMQVLSWLMRNAGTTGGKPWLPRALRDLPYHRKLELATNPAYEEAWIVGERKKCEDPAYFVSQYGSLEGPQRLPFDLWPFQEEALGLMVENKRTVFLKARQVGFTTLALHLSLHAIAFDPQTPTARVLVLSKKGEDASKLIVRARNILTCLPAYLRPQEDRSTLASKTELQLKDRGAIKSLMGTPEQARSEPAISAVIVDELAFYPNKGAADTLTAVMPTSEQGKVWVVSTGNGRLGDGEAFYRLYTEASQRRIDFVSLFVPSSDRPGRGPEWREQEKRTYTAFKGSEEEFEAEYPETEEQAFARDAQQRVFPMHGLSAATKLGEHYDALLAEGRLPEPTGLGLIVGVDWGNFRTHAVPIWPLEQGGIYIPPGEVRASRQDVEDITRRILDSVDALPAPLALEAYDASFAQSNRTFIRESERILGRHNPVTGLGRPPTRPVPFNKYKDAVVHYLQLLLRRSGEGEMTRILAISPQNKLLLKEMGDYEVDEFGKFQKGDDDAVDSLIAGAKPVAEGFLRLKEEETDALPT